jgi:hypothetical protein
LTTARGAQANDAAVEIPNHPFLLQRAQKDCSAERAAKVRPPLAPVHARESKAPPERARTFDIDSQHVGKAVSASTCPSKHRGRRADMRSALIGSGSTRAAILS